MSFSMYKKILVPLDRSKRAEMIRPSVRELASRFQATVILIRVIEHTDTSFVAEEFTSFGEKDFDAISFGRGGLNKFSRFQSYLWPGNADMPCL